MKEMEQIFKAFANRRRLAILVYLKKNRKASIHDIAKEIRMSEKSTSRHLCLLARANILDREQRSPEAFYFFNENLSPAARQLLQIL